MADDPSLPPVPSSDEEMAAALDAALDALQHGRPIDRAALLARYPALGSVLDALGQMFGSGNGNGHAETPLARPRQIGPYVIERELGAGGFGVVYLGYDPDVKRRVAVKVLHPGRIDQPEALARFQREAHANGRLRHPGIVQLFDYSRQGPPWFLVTEFVEGTEPRAWCRDRQATPHDVAALVARIADAVEYAHGHGVYHRDLKPGNILVDEQGQPHVLDFGLARLDAGLNITLTVPTAEGHILGSLPYMPPEQASGQSHTADARSDVYSLGVILYELLTGQLPFQGPAHELPARVMECMPPAPRSVNPSIPRDLEAVCLRAIARRPQDRYARAADLAADLRAFGRGEPVSVRPLGVVGRVRRVLDRRHLETLRRGWTALLLSLGFVILAGSVVVNHWEQNLPPGRAWYLVLLTKAVQLGCMALLARFLWPGQEGASSSLWRWADRTAGERQVLSLAAGYYGGLVILTLMNALVPSLNAWLPPPPGDPPVFRTIPPAPVLALLAGMGFLNLGATVWGWFYVWGSTFLALAVLIILLPGYGTTILGVGWFVCLVVGSVHLYWSR